MTDQVRRIFTATGIIGVPGSGKTSLADGLSVYLWETFHKVLCLYSWDGGAIPTLIQKRMRQGLIRFWRARTRSAPGLGIEGCYLASKGYWPAAIDPETGETAPDVRMVAPVTTKYTAHCPAGHLLTTVQHRAQLIPMFCATCKQMIPIETMKIDGSAVRTKGFEQVGGVFFDGLTSMCHVVMDHMDLSRGAGLIGGEKPAFGGVVQSGDQKFGGNNRADVGFGQSRAQQFVNNALGIPYLVEGPVFTGLAMEATDEGGLPIVGMKLPGRAATDEASAWFGNLFEMGRTDDERGHPHVTLFLRPFTDAQNRRHLLKCSASPWGLPDVLVDPPLSEHKPGAIANLGDVFRRLDEDLKNELAKADLPDAPGLASAPGSYGEPLTVSEPATPTVQTATVAVTPQAAGSPQVATTAPATQTPAVAPVATPRARSKPAPAPAAAPVSGTTPPPPPGMRPPAKAPGS